MAGKVGLNLYTNGRSMHLLTSRKLPAGLFRLVSSQRFARLVLPFTQRATLIYADADRLRKARP